MILASTVKALQSLIAVFSHCRNALQYVDLLRIWAKIHLICKYGGEISRGRQMARAVAVALT